MTEGPDAVFRPAAPRPGVGRRAGAVTGSRRAARFLLYVGGLSPHKNLPRLIEAFARVGPRRTCGSSSSATLGDVFHTHVPELRAAVERCGLGDGSTSRGSCPTTDLVLPLQPRLRAGAAVADGGLRPAARRGDGLRHAGALQHGGLAARGRRRRGRLLRPDRRRGDRRGAAAGCSTTRPRATDLRGEGAAARRAVHLGRRGPRAARLLRRARPEAPEADPAPAAGGQSA